MRAVGRMKPAIRTAERPTAAPARFPYAHRTVAQMDAVAARDIERQIMAARSQAADEPGHWCTQCDSRVSVTRASVCGSRFCSLKHFA